VNEAPPANEVPATPERIEVLDGGRLRVAASFASLLRAHGLDSFERVMAWRGGSIARSFPGRVTVRLELPLPAGGRGAFYLKRYGRDYLSSGRLALRALRLPGGEDEAMREWEALRALRAAGFRTAASVAVGADVTLGIVTRSFVMTAEIKGVVPAHHWLRTAPAPERRQAAVEVAELTERFHRSGFVHQDYYLSHILIAPGAAGKRALFLIDLQRVFRPRVFRRRWIVKDLAQLGYSAQVAGASRTDLFRFYRAYVGGRRLGPADKPRLRWIARRMAALHARRPKYEPKQEGGRTEESED
jgi:hypothetical protein